MAPAYVVQRISRASARLRPCPGPGEAERSQARRKVVDQVTRVGKQLARGARVAQVMRALAKKPGAPVPHVQPRSHSIAIRLRMRDGHRRLERDVPDAPERAMATIRSFIGSPK